MNADGTYLITISTHYQSKQVNSIFGDTRQNFTTTQTVTEKTIITLKPTVHSDSSSKLIPDLDILNMPISNLYRSIGQILTH